MLVIVASAGFKLIALNIGNVISAARRVNLTQSFQPDTTPTGPGHIGVLAQAYLRL